MSRKYFWICFLALFVVAAFLRLYDLEADPPNHFEGLGQALLTDPYHITVYARNQVLFGEWNIFDYDRWVAFKVSLMSGVAWLVFLVGGVSRFTANFASVILNLLSGLLIALGMYSNARGDPHRSERSAIHIGVIVFLSLFAVSHTLIVFGRAPFLENGLIFLSALTFLIAVRWRDRSWGIFLVGALVPLCALAGKLFGIVIAVPVLAVILMAPENRGRRVAKLFGGALLATGLWYMTALEGSVADYHLYLSEQSMGLYGFPPGLTSPKMFFEQLVSYGAESRLFHMEPVLPTLLTIAIFALIQKGRGLKLAHLNPAVIFLCVWVITAWLALMPFHYRPQRYALFILLPALGVVGFGVSAFFSEAGKALIRRTEVVPWKWIAPTLIGIWLVVTQLFVVYRGVDQISDEKTLFTWWAFPIALVLTGAFVFLRSHLAKLKFGQLRFAICGIVIISISVQLYWFGRMVSKSMHELKHASLDLRDTLSSNAVLTGPFAPALTIDNNLRCVIYSFGLRYDDLDLFQKFPITHIASDDRERVMAEQKFRDLHDLEMCGYWVARINGIRLYRLPSDSLRPVKYILTDYERSEFKRSKLEIDSAIFYGEKFVWNFPDNRTARRALLFSLAASGSYDSALSVGRRMLDSDPTDFNTAFLLARVMHGIYKNLRTPEALGEREYYVARAIELNPAAEKMIRANMK